MVQSSMVNKLKNGTQVSKTLDYRTIRSNLQDSK
ncbi:hypothetical protein BVRB_7g179550 [Beta vulgaris subsp. vulgaris]|uniref:Uncharacterized protein n=1 Tax=Beta vulgaris subsp. vulgaris TaxID=3555 RepID=A0A0J8B7Q0_BETVV|nr:hypothetical protein BVRB_7g179550 [Beta vulgaris subsp. vulgaris]